MPEPYPTLETSSADEIRRTLSALVFTKAREWRRPIYLTPQSRDKILKALNAYMGESDER